MNRVLKTSLLLAAGWMLTVSLAQAADDERHDRHEQGEEHREHQENRYFEERHRTVVHEYYEQESRREHCPPGLAKKHNGCMAPGQAKRWQLGQRLPREVVYHDLPSELVVRMGPPPRGQRYVRVDSDILLIALGTGLVVDAIENLDH